MWCQHPWSRMPHKAVAEELAITRAGRCRDTVEPWGNQVAVAACVPLKNYGYPVWSLAAVRGNQSDPALAYAGPGQTPVPRGRLCSRPWRCHRHYRCGNHCGPIVDSVVALRVPLVRPALTSEIRRLPSPRFSPPHGPTRQVTYYCLGVALIRRAGWDTSMTNESGEPINESMAPARAAEKPTRVPPIRASPFGTAVDQGCRRPGSGQLGCTLAMHVPYDNPPSVPIWGYGQTLANF